MSVARVGVTILNVSATGPMRISSPSFKQARAGDGFALHERAVLAAEVFDARLVTADDDARVAAGDAGRRRFGWRRSLERPMSTLPSRERELPIGGSQIHSSVAALHSPRVAPFRPRRPRSDSRSDARFARTPDPLRGVPERAPDLGDERGEVGLADERRGPEAFLKLRLRHRARAMLDEQQQQVERLRRQPDFAPSATSSRVSLLSENRANRYVTVPAF